MGINISYKDTFFPSFGESYCISSFLRNLSRAEYEVQAQEKNLMTKKYTLEKGMFYSDSNGLEGMSWNNRVSILSYAIK